MTDNNENKVLNVPHLRFPEFSGEWEIYPLTDFMSFKNGMNPDAKRFGRGTKFISVMDILNNQFICYDNIRASVEVVDGDIETYGVNYGDILFQRSSETLEDVGQANVYLDSKPAVFGGFVIRGKSKSNYYPMFFRYLLASPTARKKIIVKGAGAQHFNIGQDGLSKVCLNIPSIQEQEKIAKLFECIDTRIATQNKIIEKLETLIKGIRHNIFKQLRKDVGFNATIGNILSFEQPQRYIVSSAEYSSDCTFTPVLTANKAFILGYTTETDGIYSKGDCIIIDDFTLDCKYVSFPFKVKSSAIKILTAKNKYILRYTYEYLKSLELSTEEHKRHYIAEVQPHSCVLPDENTLKTIAMVFENLACKLADEQSLVLILNKQKQYLLSKMFI